MKTHIIIFSLLLSICGFAQTAEQVDQVDIKNLPYDQVFFPCSFGEDNITAIRNLDELRFQTVTEVSLVYSEWKTSQNFDQQALNESRRKALMLAWPELFEQDMIHWRFLEQTDAQNKSEAQLLPHGYLITYRPKATSEMGEAELNEYNALLESTPPRLAVESELLLGSEVISLESYTAAEAPISIGDWTNYLIAGSAGYFKKDEQLEFKFDIDPKGRVINVEVTGSESLVKFFQKRLRNSEMWKPATRSGAAVTSSEAISLTYDHSANTYHFDWNALPAFMDSKAMTNRANLRNSTISTVMDRNHWQDMAVVIDVTGSMYPYTADFTLWTRLAENMGSIKCITAFNDGDKTPDGAKITGEVGGIYSRSVRHFEDIQDIITVAMRNGGGGDAPENNIEASIKTLDEFGDVQEIVMIADNFATPRDL
ncbi:MAG: hypothetical protein AAF193_07440, partial [Bacteroidota bacterium]